MGFRQPSQKADVLLSFLGYVAGVESTEEVLSKVNTKECNALDNLHKASLDVQ